MRIRHWVSFLAASVIVSGAYAADDDWSYSKSWVGKYPSATVPGKNSSLLAQPAIRSALRQVLPRWEARTLSQLTNESVVTAFEGFIVVNQCRPHNCPADMATVVIDPENKRLWVGLFTREATRVATRWYGAADDYSVLPEKIRADFISRHGE